MLDHKKFVIVKYSRKSFPAALVRKRMSGMGKIDENKLLKRNALLNAAYELFTGKGIHKTSISDIVERSGIAKGTFYLYFLDKYDLRNKLIVHKAGELFIQAEKALENTNYTVLEDRIVFFVEYIVDYLTENKTLLAFLTKNLSWGIFKEHLGKQTQMTEEGEIDFQWVLKTIFEQSPQKFKDPELMIYMIIEFVGSTVYSAILYQEPVDIQTLKPYLIRTVRFMIQDQEIIL